MFKESAFINPELFGALQHVVLITRLVGLSPVRYDKIGSGYVFKWSLKFGILSYILVLMLAIATIWGVINDLTVDVKDSVRMQNPTSKYIICCDISVIIFTVLLGVIATPFKLRHMWKALHCFQKIDTSIPIKANQNDRKRGIAAVALTLFLFSFLIIFDMTTYDRILSEQNRTIFLFLRNYMSFYLMYYIVMLQELYYWHLVSLIMTRIKSLNTFLNLKRKQLFKKTAWAGLNRSKKIEPDLSFDEIWNLTKVHDLICDAIEAVNAWWGFTVLLIMLSCLLHLVVTPYFLLMEIKNNGNPMFMALQLVWTATHICRLLVVVEPCHSCLKQNENTINLVFRLLMFEVTEDVKSQ